MTKSKKSNIAKQSEEPVIVMVFDGYWIVNGTRLDREYISEDEQIRLLKSILAHKSIQAPLEVNNNIGTSIRYDKNQQIHILKSMLIKKSYGLPKICADFIELPENIQEDYEFFRPAAEKSLKLEIETNSDDYSKETFEKMFIKTENGIQFQ